MNHDTNKGEQLTLVLVIVGLDIETISSGNFAVLWFGAGRTKPGFSLPAGRFLIFIIIKKPGSPSCVMQSGRESSPPEKRKTVSKVILPRSTKSRNKEKLNFKLLCLRVFVANLYAWSSEIASFLFWSSSILG